MDAKEAVSLPKSEFRKWVSEASIKDLDSVFSEISFLSKRQYWEIAKAELEKKRHQESIRPHWSSTPTFILVVIGTICGLACAFLAIQSYLQENEYSSAYEEMPTVEQTEQSLELKP